MANDLPVTVFKIDTGAEGALVGNVQIGEYVVFHDYDEEKVFIEHEGQVVEIVEVFYI